MKIIPIAFDSLGTRSMATYVETKDIKILIDPGVSLAPSRYGLPPHKIEIERMEEHWNEILKFSKISNAFIISHYHYDHHNPDDVEIFKDKILFIKHPKEKINLSQKNRAKEFLEKVKEIPKEIIFADGKEFSYGDTKIKFSNPVYHGTNPQLGYVIETLIIEKEKNKEFKFIHTSDVEGPSIDDQVNFIIENKVNIVILDGPLSYMLGYRYSKKSLEISIENMKRMIQECPLEKLIIDHHFLRDLEWKEKISELFEIAEKKGTKILTAAEFLGKENDLLEARRKELYKNFKDE